MTLRFAARFRKLPCSLIFYVQAVAKAVLPAKAWAYYSSASDDEITIRENRAAYQRFVQAYKLFCIVVNFNDFLGYGSVPVFFVMFLLLIGQQLSSDKDPRFQCIS